jgi:hypothetical protein
LTLTIAANPALVTKSAVMEYIEELQSEHPELRPYTYALIDIVNTKEDDRIEIYDEPDMEGDFVSSTNGTHLIWMPDVGRAVVNAYQASDWQWTDAASPEDALRRYHEGELSE